MATYKTAEEVKKAIDDNNRIEGVVEVTIDNIQDDPEYFFDDMTDKLVGGDYGYLLEDVSYKIVGCDVEKQTILLKVNADANALLEETDWLSEFEDQG